ncbi:tetratricopeptide repeat protein [Rhodohalobacter sp.]|uniref:tetratricopeptide repeat protein n=1 Tax=Rhodohalobacter sp. TaxID=1974210 RepID=UPI002ACD9400|nr:tetratricopeptide repeat protein [Rhodohalobacter sp.]MDZ7757733.1 tetratricopeptide repeat protein [Rhodohalobacter sp.]
MKSKSSFHNSAVVRFLSAMVICILFVVPVRAQSNLQYEAGQYYEEGEFSMAIELLEEVIRRDIMRPDAHVMLISSHLQTGGADKALDLSMEAQELFPGMHAFTWLLAESQMQLENVEEARHQYNIVEEHINRGASFMPLAVDRTQLTIRFGQLDLMQAAEAYQNGELETAIRFMKNARTKLPPSPDLDKNLVVLYAETEQYDKGLSLLESARTQHPENLELIRLQAMYYQQMENTEEMVSTYQEIVENNPGSVDDTIIYAQLLFQTKESNKAVALLEELLEQHPKERRIYNTLIEFFENSFNIPGKRNTLLRMAKQFPDDRSILLEIAKTYELEKEWAKARTLYDSLAVETGDELIYGLLKANTYEQQDSLEVAEGIYQNLYEVYPNDEVLLARRGANYEDQQKWKLAAGVYKILTEVKPDAPGPHSRLGVSYYKSGELESALSVLEKAVELESDNPETELYLSRLYHQQKDDEKAMRLAKTALELSLTKLAESQQEMQGQIQTEGMYSLMGRESSGEDAEALNRLSEEAFEWFTNSFHESNVKPLLNRILEEYPLSAKLFAMSGAYYKESGDRDEALRLLEEAVRLAPSLADAQLLLGELYADAGNAPEAIRSYRRALSLSPEMPEPYRALIKLYRNNDDLDSLCDRWLAMYRAAPHNEVLRSHLIEALHKAGRISEATEIVQNHKSE